MSKQNREQSRTEKAAAIQALQARKERNKRVALIAGVVVVLSAIVAGVTIYSSSGSGSSDDADNSSVAVSAGDSSILVGNSDAPVKVVIYEDFLCPFCRQLEDSTRDFLRENASKGKVQIEYQPINLLQDYSYSLRSLNAWGAVLKNATPRVALKLHDLFYENQPYETSSDSTTDADIAALVKKAGGTSSAVTTALKTQNTSFLTSAAQVMTDKGINSTPTVFINGKELTGLGVPDIAKAIEKAVSDGA
jgi:protein-disulfide isomerase